MIPKILLSCCNGHNYNVNDINNQKLISDLNYTWLEDHGQKTGKLSLRKQKLLDRMPVSRSDEINVTNDTCTIVVWSMKRQKIIRVKLCDDMKDYLVAISHVWNDSGIKVCPRNNESDNCHIKQCVGANLLLSKVFDAIFKHITNNVDYDHMIDVLIWCDVISIDQKSDFAIRDATYTMSYVYYHCDMTYTICTKINSINLWMNSVWTVQETIYSKRLFSISLIDNTIVRIDIGNKQIEHIKSLDNARGAIKELSKRCGGWPQDKLYALRHLIPKLRSMPCQYDRSFEEIVTNIIRRDNSFTYEMFGIVRDYKYKSMCFIETASIIFDDPMMINHGYGASYELGKGVKVGSHCFFTSLENIPIEEDDTPSLCKLLHHELLNHFIKLRCENYDQFMLDFSCMSTIISNTSIENDSKLYNMIFKEFFYDASDNRTILHYYCLLLCDFFDDASTRKSITAELDIMINTCSFLDLIAYSAFIFGKLDFKKYQKYISNRSVCVSLNCLGLNVYSSIKREFYDLRRLIEDTTDAPNHVDQEVLKGDRNNSNVNVIVGSLLYIENPVVNRFLEVSVNNTGCIVLIDCEDIMKPVKCTRLIYGVKNENLIVINNEQQQHYDISDFTIKSGCLLAEVMCVAEPYCGYISGSHKGNIMNEDIKTRSDTSQNTQYNHTTSSSYINKIVIKNEDKSRHECYDANKNTGGKKQKQNENENNKMNENKHNRKDNDGTAKQYDVSVIQTETPFKRMKNMSDFDYIKRSYALCTDAKFIEALYTNKMKRVNIIRILDIYSVATSENMTRFSLLIETHRCLSKHDRYVAASEIYFSKCLDIVSGFSSFVCSIITVLFSVKNEVNYNMIRQFFTRIELQVERSNVCWQVEDCLKEFMSSQTDECSIMQGNSLLKIIYKAMSRMRMVKYISINEILIYIISKTFRVYESDSPCIPETISNDFEIIHMSHVRDNDRIAEDESIFMFVEVKIRRCRYSVTTLLKCSVRNFSDMVIDVRDIMTCSVIISRLLSIQHRQRSGIVGSCYHIT